MGRVLVIGAGGVSTVAVKKIAMNADVFTDIMVASRTKSKYSSHLLIELILLIYSLQGFKPNDKYTMNL